MNEKVKRISELKRSISMIEFQDYLSNQDYITINTMEDEIKTLKNELRGTTGVVVKLTRTYGTNVHTSYLTSDSILCFSDDPTLFDNKEEAKDYLDRADLVKDNYEIEFVEMKY